MHNERTKPQVDNTPRSDTFFSPRPLTQKQQESAVATAFLRLYAPQCDPAKVPHGPCEEPTPPDWLFEFHEMLVGVEMTEVDQYYPLRARERLFTDFIYAAFHSCTTLSFDLTGLSIGVLRSEKALTAESGNLLRKAAQELVELVSRSLTSIEELRPIHSRDLRVDQNAYPNLFELASSVSLGLGPDRDIRRSDGKAAPIIIMEGGRLIDDELNILWYLKRLSKKCRDRRRSRPPTGWSRVAHSVLLFHDHPRRENYTFAGKKFLEGYLQEAASRISENDVIAFDEILLLTYRSLDFELIQITGTRPSRLTLRSSAQLS